MRIEPHHPLQGRLQPPGDKSISHRALLLAAIADGDSVITNFLPSRDCLATLACVRDLGVHITVHDHATLTVHGRGLHGLRSSTGPLDCVRSGTTMRLLAGLLSGQAFSTILTGEEQLLRRPMERVAGPLRRLGAKIETSDGHAPLSIHAGELQGGNLPLSVPSAQVKSALLLAGLYASSPVSVHQSAPTRDHTERMLAWMGADITIDVDRATVNPTNCLSPLSIGIPGDISAAAFPIVGAAIVPGSEVILTGVGINATRTGIVDVLQEMGAQIDISHEHMEGNEPVGQIRVSASALRGVRIGGETVVRMIDELPLLAVAATQAEGRTEVCDAAELRVKETDRIATVVAELRKLGARIEEKPDGLVVEGPTALTGGTVDSHGDHRLAMALAIAGLVAEKEVVVHNISCIGDSFPDFISQMKSIGASYD
ncbi:MAG TPA: 3-phosphoshikimate 1-carboxyvinyltransferase [Candidatus Acetothermia bacterium]|nr:3-phosphoshikimate 1-carboxyvinyltransferase [Candidatus Acetothermia bacterium]